MKNAVCIVVLTLAALPCSARTITVDDDNPADFNNIQAAIDDANSGDTVEIQPGTYTGPGNRDIDFLGKAITVTGTDHADPNTVAETIIDCNATETERHRGFNFVSGEGRDSVLAGLTIMNGYGHDESVGDHYLSSAGAIWCEGSGPTIIGCQIRNNTVWHMGGGIYCKASDPLIANCLFAGNIGHHAGAIGNENSSPTIINCSFTSNAVPEDGGALRNSYASRPVISNCLFRNNSARMGGAIRETGGCNSTLVNCVFTNNSSSDNGGAIALGGGPARIFNCAFISNYANENGGAILNSTNNPQIVNCTFIDNSAGLNGRVIANYYGGRPTLTNCIVWKGGGSYESTIFLTKRSSILIRYCNIRGGEEAVAAASDSWCDWGEGNIDLDPLFESDKYHLQSASPCIDSGDSSAGYSSGSDIDGQPRLIGAAVDIGADEYGTDQPPLLLIHPSRVKAKVAFGEANPVTASFSLFATASEQINWTVSENCPWLDVPDDSGTLEGGSVEILINIGAEGLSTGRHCCTLEVSDGHPEHDPAVVTVDLVVYTQGQLRVPAEFETIQAAIDAAAAADTVLVADGTYTGYGNQDIDFRGKRITVRSEIGPDGCIIDCERSARAFYFHSGEDEHSVLQGFTITNGYFRDRGGAMHCNRSGPTITDCRFVRNSSGGDGGAIYNAYGSPRFLNCLFSDNTAQDIGGAISNYRANGCVLDDCTFLRNSADDHGGAIHGGGPNSAFTRCFFTRNSARVNGGALHGVSSNSSMRGCIFTGNSAGVNGGAVYGISSNSDVRGCIFTGNSAGDDGGAVYLSDYCGPAIMNCTFTGNEALIRGGAIFHQGGSEAIVVNCILWDNWPTETYNNYRLQIKYSNVRGGVSGQGNIDADPCFADAENGDYHLSEGSPCIDSGDSDYIPEPGETDMDAEPRVMGEGVDMGADEFTSVLAPILTIWPPEFEFFSYKGGPHSGTQTLHIVNRGSGDLYWQCVEDCNWIDVSSYSGVLSMGEVAEVLLMPNVSGLVSGRYDCLFNITADGAFDAPQSVAASLVVGGLNLYVPAEFPTIQAAIDAADNWDTVIVADGTYTGPGNRYIDFRGKTITVRSENGPARCIIDCNGSEGDPSVGFYFDSGVGPASIVSGFTITNNYARHYCLTRPPWPCFYPAGAIHCDLYSNASPTIRNCIITGGLGPDSYGLYVEYRGGSPTLINCTIAGQKAGGIYCDADSGATLRNCILWDNASNEISGWTDSVTADYSNIDGGWQGTGNVDADPCFADPGYWNPNGTPEDANDDFWVHGRGDYHLKSQAGRYDPNSEAWVIDEVTSPCIDAGEPLDPIAHEPFPNGGIINMGAYGGTQEAAKSYFNKPPCETIIAGDINGDCQINFEDLQLMTIHWCEENN